MQVNSPGGSLAEETIGVGVTELTPSAAHNCRAFTEPTRETHQTGVGFTPTVGVRTVITLSVDTGTGWGQTGEVRHRWDFIIQTSWPPVWCHHSDLLLSQFDPYLYEDEQYWQREPLKFGSQVQEPFPPIPSKHCDQKTSSDFYPPVFQHRRHQLNFKPFSVKEWSSGSFVPDKLNQF